ncbi:hypothetical protein GCM10025868_25160 [Angustibacter aerolatus]|uniref:Uncharacterized protein n=1 Tax=Angustibacter aerolatus TaxID=1162965 RepID=A0ABQ6JGB5_9ACTN|nr:ECF transporter S component [Angustibacter aerolatus]GMA87266.1 hypothetical protein GCM10025868_25160 [Angustibacter aerolatus]
MTTSTSPDPLRQDADRDADRLAATRPSGPPRTALVVGAVAVVAGLLIVLVGLPDSGSLFGTPLHDLTVPLALVVGLGGLWVAGSLAANRAGWRVVDIVVASVLGVAGGLLFALWNANYATISAPLSAVPAVALLGGVWLLPAVLGGLVIRKPGAATYAEPGGCGAVGADRQPVGLLGRLVRPARGPRRRDRLRAAALPPLRPADRDAGRRRDRRGHLQPATCCSRTRRRPPGSRPCTPSAWPCPAP